MHLLRGPYTYGRGLDICHGGLAPTMGVPASAMGVPASAMGVLHPLQGPLHLLWGPYIYSRGPCLCCGGLAPTVGVPEPTMGSLHLLWVCAPTLEPPAPARNPPYPHPQPWGGPGPPSPHASPPDPGHQRGDRGQQGEEVGQGRAAALVPDEDSRVSVGQRLPGGSGGILGGPGGPRLSPHPGAWQVPERERAQLHHELAGRAGLQRHHPQAQVGWGGMAVAAWGRGRGAHGDICAGCGVRGCEMRDAGRGAQHAGCRMGMWGAGRAVGQGLWG